LRKERAQNIRDGDRRHKVLRKEREGVQPEARQETDSVEKGKRGRPAGGETGDRQC